MYGQVSLAGRLSATMGFICLFLIPLNLSEAVHIIDAGKSSAAIFLGEEATESELYAAKELRRAIRIMSGAELPFGLAVESAVERVELIIGSPTTSRLVADHPVLSEQLGGNRAGGQAYALRTEGNKVYLAGSSEIGALYAVYEFLEQLGVRWLWPGDTGEFIPSAETVTLPELDIMTEPAFELRGFRGRYGRKGGIWMARNRLNWGDRDLWRYEDKAYTIGFPNFWGGHSFGWIFPEGMPHNFASRQAYFEKHPEHFSLINGQRQLRQHCYSNPEVQNVFARWILRFWRENPDVESLALSPMDNTGFCECDACQDFGADISTQLHRFLNIIISEVEKEFPGKAYRTFAYSVYKSPPEGDVHPAITIDYCMHDRCYKHRLDDKSCPRNPAALEALNHWVGGGSEKLTMYGYHHMAVRGTHSGYLIPLAPVVQDELKRLRRMGFSGFATEICGRPRGYAPTPQNIWAANQIGVYVIGRLLWDPELDLETVLWDACETAYGPAASEMVAYKRLIWDAWMGDGHVSGYFNNPAALADLFMTRDVIEQADSILERADQRLATTDQDHELSARQSRNLELAQEVYRTWRELSCERHSWIEIARGTAADRSELLADAPAAGVLYRADIDDVEPGAKPDGFVEGCTVVMDIEGTHYIAARELSGDRLVFGNHPRIFEDGRNWINYETVLRFRFPENKPQNRQFFTLLLRTGGVRFIDEFRTCYVTVSDSRISLSVRDPAGRPVPVENGIIQYRDLGLVPLESGQWMHLRVRNVDNRLLVWLTPPDREETVLGAFDLPLGGGAINLRTFGAIDLADLKVRAVPVPATSTP